MREHVALRRNGTDRVDGIRRVCGSRRRAVNEDAAFAGDDGGERPEVSMRILGPVRVGVVLENRIAVFHRGVFVKHHREASVSVRGKRLRHRPDAATHGCAFVDAPREEGVGIPGRDVKMIRQHGSVRNAPIQNGILAEMRDEAPVPRVGYGEFAGVGAVEAPGATVRQSIRAIRLIDKPHARGRARHDAVGVGAVVAGCHDKSAERRAALHLAPREDRVCRATRETRARRRRAGHGAVCERICADIPGGKALIMDVVES